MLERSRPMRFGPFSRSIIAALLAAVLAGTAAQAQALGLGDITLHSSLGQPLSADIALVDAQGLDNADLSVALASADEFARAGVDRAFFLNDLRFQPVLRGDRKFIHVSSSKAVTEPYLDFLVQLNRPSGQLLREFTVLLDPPGTVNLPPAPKLDDSPVSSIASAANATSAPVRPAAPKAPVALPPATQGKHLAVQKGDTFWSIATRLQAAGTPTPTAVLVRDLRALNPGQLEAGQSLLLPDVAVLPAPVPAAPPTPVAVAPVADAVPAPAPATGTVAPAEATPAAEAGAPFQPLQKDVDELNGKLQALQAQMTAKDQQVQQLQNQLAQARAARAPAPALPVVDDSGDFPWLPILGVVLILLLLAGMVYNRRRQQGTLLAPAVVFATPEPDVLIKPAQEEAVPAWELTEDEPSPAPRRESGPATDALDGASIYIAYGRFNEASAILREGLQKEPHRTDLRLRLLEVLGQQGDVAGFAEEEKALLAQDFNAAKIDAIREHYPKLQPAPQPVVAPSLAAVAAVAPAIAEAPVEPPAAAPLEDFQLNLDDLSMDADWDLVSPFDPAPARKPGDTLPDAAEPVTEEFASNLKEFPDVYELPDEQFLSDFAEDLSVEETKPADGLDDAFLDNFVAGADLPELDALTVDFDALDNPEACTEKLEQAQHCIDQGDLRSAADLLHEVLREGEEADKQAARQLLSKIA